MMENGNAATMEAVCNPCNPPLRRSTKAMSDCNIPQINFTRFEGFKSPFDDIIPRTNVAESAEVTKNVMISTMATTEITPPKGN